MGNASQPTRSPGSFQGPVAADPVEQIEVFVNVYDLCKNEKLVSLGLGLHHSGLELLGREWSFGWGEAPEGTTGVFDITPKTATPVLRSSIRLGTCTLTREQLDHCMAKLRTDWPMTSYDILTRNCNHFCEDFARRLGFRHFPAWVNRAARWSTALIPQSLLHCVVQQVFPPAADECEPPRRLEPPAAASAMQIPQDLRSLSTKRLQSILFVHGSSWDHCVEKDDLIAAVEQLRGTSA